MNDTCETSEEIQNGSIQHSDSNLEEQKANNTESVEQESDEHLPRVQVELEKLNYANESINNLELELEESKREYLHTSDETDKQLAILEKKLGSCVEKSRPYYDARIELTEAKEKYLIAKNRFETAQELYVAAKNMQMYAEENLENFALGKELSEIKRNENHGSTHYNKETLTKMLEIAKIKVNETELSKQSSDLEQIEAFKVYDEKRIRCENLEKSLKKNIEKSRKYYELKSNLYKELRFLFTKIECLKSCLKEAKSTYQESLRNLELISTEIHIQRQSVDPSYSIPFREQVKEENLSKLTSISVSSFSSSSSLVSNNQLKSSFKSIDQSDINVDQENQDEDDSQEEDFDICFKNDAESKNRKEIEIKYFSNKKSDDSVTLQDEQIENLKLDNKLKMYNENLRKDEDCFQKQDLPKSNSPILSKFKVLFK